MSEFWDNRYDSEEYVYGKEPNAYFAEELLKLKPGKLLMPAEGEGRNAVFAAKNGWEVTAFDSSSVAKNKALALAKENKVEISYTVSDVEHFSSKEKFDAVALIFAHFPEENRKRYHQKITGLLKKGGILILEAFTKEQIHNSSGGPKKESMLFSEEILRRDFTDLEIVKLEEKTTSLDEGPHHRGEAAVIRMIAKKATNI